MPSIAVYWKSFADYGCPYCGFRYQTVHTAGGRDYMVKCIHCGNDFTISFSAFASGFGDLRVSEHPGAVKGEPHRGFSSSDYDSFVPIDSGEDLIGISLTSDNVDSHFGESGRWQNQELFFKSWPLASKRPSDLYSGIRGMCFLMGKEHVCNPSVLSLNLLAGYRAGRGVAERFRLAETLMMSYVEFGGVFTLQMGVCLEHIPNAERLLELVRSAKGNISCGSISQAKEYIP